jgi:hypothetical protein
MYPCGLILCIPTHSNSVAIDHLKWCTLVIMAHCFFSVTKVLQEGFHLLPCKDVSSRSSIISLISFSILNFYI